MRRGLLDGEERRHGGADRRDRWRRFFRVAVLCLIFYIAGGATVLPMAAGIPADALAEAETARAEQLEQVRQGLDQQLAAIRDSLIVNPRVIERRVPFLVRDTVWVPAEPVEAPPPQVVRVEVPADPITVPGPVRIVEVPIVQPPGVCFDPHSFTSSHTFRPSIGNFAWSAGGFLLGLLMTVEATAEAEVYVQ